VKGLLKDLKIRNKILLGIGTSFLVGMLIVSGVIYFQFDNLAQTSHDSLKNSLLNKEREKVKQLVQTRAQSLGQLYRTRKNQLSTSKLKNLIADKNEPIRFGDGNYFYIYSIKGETISLPPDREKERTNRWDLKVSGKYLLREMAELAKSDGGFFTYDYKNPNTEEIETKFGYIEPIPGTDWFVGAGGYQSVVNSTLEKKQAEINKYKYQTLMSIAAVFVVIILIIIGIVVIISRYLTTNINQLLTGMHKLADGNLNIKLETDSKDEIGELKATFQQAVANQRKTIRGIVNVIDDISAYSEQLSASAEETDSVLETITNNIDQLAGGIKQVADGSEEVSQLSQKANQRTKVGTDIADQVMTKMETTDQLAVEAQEVMVSLDDTAQEIRVLIDMITDIAEQTNLLALNASIEAARADSTGSGPGNGQGFSVVAEEIKELAEKTSQTADKAIELIEKIKARSNEGLESIKEVTNQTAEESNLIEQTGDAFADIAETVEETSVYVQETTASTEELAVTSEQVEKATEDVKHMSEEVAKSAEELAELAQRLKELKENYNL